MVKAMWNGQVAADAEDTIVVEGNQHCSRASVRVELLKESMTTRQCPWKGTARYLKVVVHGTENKDAAWYYPEPFPAVADIKDRVAFWKGVQVA
ncbi:MULTISPECIES: DUF427 domain-containing protein [Sphingosinicellaceae]|uniref:DUF427 domain-containing protein n=1 Tax=Sphingosinicellaceae TaxID=2820280 RepID=UPI001C1DD0FE|nr:MULTISPECIES: DUF427 domain-containing protein [Polymorphobacter]QYE35681.1 DUF427 domain-containing protein [Polymorphobacter sp. PAMC 29334]UAJ10951.1 DUF427 domain-containing protein [Polymorphobacter megasporae]